MVGQAKNSEGKTGAGLGPVTILYPARGQRNSGRTVSQSVKAVEGAPKDPSRTAISALALEDASKKMLSNKDARSSSLTIVVSTVDQVVVNARVASGAYSASRVSESSLTSPGKPPPPPVAVKSAKRFSAADQAIILNNAAVEMSRRLEYERALELLQKAIGQAPGNYKFERNLSIVYEGMKKYDDALAAALRANEIAPNEPSVLAQLCGLHALTGNDAEAIPCYEKLLALSPEDGLSLSYYAVTLLRYGKVSKAMPILEKLVRTQPTAALFNALGIAYMDQKQYREAAAAFKNAVEADPDRTQLRYNLAIAQLSIGNKAGAISQYKLLKETNSDLAAKLFQILFRDRIITAPKS